MRTIDLPREKLKKYGRDRLADYELLAIILGSGIKNTNVLELSKKILRRASETGITKLRQEDLMEVRGLGGAKAAQIIAILELGHRLHERRNPQIISAEDVWKLCADIRDSKREHFVAFYLNSQNHLIERQIISIGTLNASLVHPREVFEPALTLHAASIIVAHNHPSGICESSIEDREITRRLFDSGKLLGIHLLHHIILTSKEFTAVKVF